MYYTTHYSGYEIWNHEVGTITFFESYESLREWEENNRKDPKRYKDYGVRLVVTNQTDLYYYWED